MRVIVYVEGASDKAAMSALLSPLIERKRHEGIRIEFYETPPGDRKVSLLRKAPVRAANIILNDPEAIVIVMPDLYPLNKGVPHSNVAELEAGVREEFEKALCKKRGGTDSRHTDRFKFFCLKYDLESLILAAQDSLRMHLGARILTRKWKTPVEEQDDDNPPKKIVEAVFAEHDRMYHPTIDAPLILRSCDYLDLAERCSQCFKPFVEFLENISRDAPGARSAPGS